MPRFDSKPSTYAFVIILTFLYKYIHLATLNALYNKSCVFLPKAKSLGALACGVRSYLNISGYSQHLGVKQSMFEEILL